jgi:hypothetical protein
MGGKTIFLLKTVRIGARFENNEALYDRRERLKETSFAIEKKRLG